MIKSKKHLKSKNYNEVNTKLMEEAKKLNK